MQQKALLVRGVHVINIFQFLKQDKCNNMLISKIQQFKCLKKFKKVWDPRNQDCV